MSDARHDGALATLRRFVEANARQDNDAMKACLTRASLESGNFSGSTPPGVEFRLDAPEDEGGRVVIPLRVHSTEAPPDAPPLDTLRCVMVEEDGEWKFDLLSTMSPMMEQMEQAMTAAMGQLGEAMGEAFQAVGEAMGAALGAGSGGELTSVFTGEPLVLSTFEDAPDLPTEAELVAMPEVVNLPGLTASLSEVLGRHIPVGADVKGIMGLFGADDPTELMPWLENDFPRGLVAAIDVASRGVPTETARLRAVRIEAAYDWMDRSISLDGPDLVYRADMRDPGGWYTEDELGQIILGVIAGMPERAAEYPPGFGDQPRGEPMPSPDMLREVRTPREMRRLSRVLGNGQGTPIALDIDWTNLWPTDQFVRNWCVWGLPRLIGAVRLAYPEGAEPVPEGFIRVIRLNLGYGEREASLDGGVLSMTIQPIAGEKGCFYEHELCRALLGEPILPAGAGDGPDVSPDPGDNAEERSV